MHIKSLIKLKKMSLERLGRRALGQKSIAYVGCQGNGNLGDDAMYQIAQNLFDSYLIPARPSTMERRLERLKLSAKLEYRAMLLGGGTLINERFIEPLERAQRYGIPFATFGSGVGSSGFEQANFDLSGWASLLNQAKGVGVRGPRSAERLRSIGVKNVEIVGDPALLRTTTHHTPWPSQRPAIAINIAAPCKNNSQEGTELSSITTNIITQYAKHFESIGYQVHAIAMTPNDMHALKQWGGCLDQNTIKWHQPKTSTELQAILSECRLCFSVRLHTAVFSSTVGLPTILIGYREKCYDFMQSIGRGDWVIDPHDLKKAVDQGIALAEEAVTAKDQMRYSIWSESRRCKENLYLYIQRLNDLFSMTESCEAAKLDVKVLP